MIDREKYITVKREDLPLDLLDALSPYEITDARVIRDQDIFASSAFYAYGNHIRGVMEFMAAVGYNVPATFEQMQDLADYFISAAECAENIPHRKIPD